MDRERLKEVRETDLTESKVNQDFVDWLRNKGPTWLLVILVILVAWLFFIRYKEGQTAAHNNAFADLSMTVSPEALEQVAIDNEGVASVPELARMQAADTLLAGVLSGTAMDQPDEELTPEQKQADLDEARGLYQAVLEATRDDVDRQLFAIQALFGLAAVAEASGDFDLAAEHYKSIQSMAGDRFKVFTDQAGARLATLDAARNVRELVSREALPARNPIDPLLQDLLEVGEYQDEPADDTSATQEDASGS